MPQPTLTWAQLIDELKGYVPRWRWDPTTSASHYLCACEAMRGNYG